MLFSILLGYLTPNDVLLDLIMNIKTHYIA